MSRMSMFGKFSCQEGQGAAMDAALVEQMAAADGVDGVEVYSYSRGEGDEYHFFALYSSQDAMMAFGETDAMKAAMPAFMALLAGPPEMFTAVPVGA